MVEKGAEGSKEEVVNGEYVVLKKRPLRFYKNRASPFQWTPAITTLYVKVLREQHKLYPKSRRGIYKRVADEINKHTGSNLSGHQASNKWDNLRREWIKWYTLLQKPGAVWNKEKDTIVADDAWWAERQKEVGEYIIKYRDAPLSNRRDLDLIFKGRTSTGSCACALMDTPSPSYNGECSDPPNETEAEVDMTSLENDASPPSNQTNVLETPAVLQPMQCPKPTAPPHTHKATRCPRAEKSPIYSQEEISATSGVPYQETFERVKNLGGDFEEWEIIDILLHAGKRLGISLVDDDQARMYVENAVREKRAAQGM